MLLGIFLLGAWLFPFAWLKAVVDSLASDGEVESFSGGWFAAIRPGLLVAGLVLLVLGIILVMSRRAGALLLARLPGRLAHGARRFSHDLRQIYLQLGTRSYDRRYLSALAFLTVLALFIRLLYLSQPMRYDESYTYLVFATRPLDFIISDYHVPNNHVLHTLLVGLATRLLGNQPWVIRLPAVAAGVLMVPATYLLGRMSYGRFSGLLAAALVASSSFMIEYSTNGRGYTLISLLTLLFFALGIYLKDHQNAAAWTFFVLLAAAGFYTMPTFLYPFGALMLWLLLSALVGDVSRAYDGGFWKHLFIAGLGIGLLTVFLYTPILLESGLAKLTDNAFVQAIPADRFLYELQGSFISTWRSWVRDLLAWQGWVLAFGFIASLVWHRQVARQRLPLSPLVVFWCGALLLLQRVAPWPRVWLFMMPLFFICASAGLRGFLGRFFATRADVWARIGIAVAVTAAVLLSWNVFKADTIVNSGQTGTLKPAEAITRYLQDALQPGDVVAAVPPSNYPLRYYFDYYGLPEEAFYRPRIGPEFNQAWIVINQQSSDTLADVLHNTRLAQYIDPARAEVARQFEGAQVLVFRRIKAGDQ